VLKARCQSCHNNPTLNNAKMPLLTWSDFNTWAPSIQNELDAGEMPPATAPQLSSNQLNTLLNYLSLGTPSAGNVTCP